MPFRSERQRRYMYAKHPDIAARWSAEYGSKIQPQPQPRRKVKGSVSHRRRRRAR